MLLKSKAPGVYVCELTKDLESLYGYRDVVLKRVGLSVYNIVVSYSYFGRFIVTRNTISKMSVPIVGITSKYMGAKIEFEEKEKTEDDEKIKLTEVEHDPDSGIMTGLVAGSIFIPNKTQDEKPLKNSKPRYISSISDEEIYNILQSMAFKITVDDAIILSKAQEVIAAEKLARIYLEPKLANDQSLVYYKSNLLEDFNEKFERKYKMVSFNSRSLVIYNGERVHPEMSKGIGLTLVLNNVEEYNKGYFPTDSFTVDIVENKLAEVIEPDCWKNIDDDIYKIMMMYLKDLVGTSVVYPDNAMIKLSASPTNFMSVYFYEFDMLNKFNKDMSSNFRMVSIDMDVGRYIIYDANEIELVMLPSDKSEFILWNDKNNTPANDYIILSLINSVTGTDIVKSIKTKSGIEITDMRYHSFISALKDELLYNRLEINKIANKHRYIIRAIDKDIEFTEYSTNNGFGFYRWDFLESINRKYNRKIIITKSLTSIEDDIYYILDTTNANKNDSVSDIIAINDHNIKVELDSDTIDIVRYMINGDKKQDEVYEIIHQDLIKSLKSKLKVRKHTDIWLESIRSMYDVAIDTAKEAAVFKEVKCWVSQFKEKNGTISLFAITDKLYKIKTDNDTLKHLYIEDVSTELFEDVYNVYFGKYDTRYRVGAIIIRNCRIEVIGFYDKSLNNIEEIMQELASYNVNFLIVNNTILTWTDDYKKYELVIDDKTWYCDYILETSLAIYSDPSAKPDDPKPIIGMLTIEYGEGIITDFRKSDYVCPHDIKRFEDHIGSRLEYKTKKKEDNTELHDYSWLMENIYNEENLTVKFRRKSWVVGKNIFRDTIELDARTSVKDIIEEEKYYPNFRMNLYEPTDEDKKAGDWYRVE